MAAIIDPEAVRFCNEKLRRVADVMGNAYYLAKSLSQEWTANNLGALFPSGEGPVADGSEVDGRHPLSGDDVTLLIVRCNELVADYEASTNAKLNTILNVSVDANRISYPS